MLQIFTITARNYLAQALTLGDSVARYHPEAAFTVFVADGLDGIDLAAVRHRVLDAAVAFDSEQILDLEFKYDVTEFCTALKPGIFRFLFAADSGTDFVFYLDPDTRLYGSLDGVAAEAPEKSLFLTPHLIECRLEDDNPYPEYRHLWEGVFNLGFCGVRRGPVADRILAWWHARLMDYCFADFSDGLHTDQKWMDYAPAFWGDQVQVVRHYGVNVAHWNLIERELVSGDRGFTCRGEPLLLFHFSGLDFTSGAIAEKHVPRSRQRYLSEALRDLLDAYCAEVAANGYDDYIALPWKFAAYSDGVVLDRLQRRLYRVWSRRESASDPFAEKGEFRRLLGRVGLVGKKPHGMKGNTGEKRPGNGKGGEGRRQALSRLLLKTVLRLFGHREYNKVLRFCAHYGRPENHFFLIDKSSKS